MERIKRIITRKPKENVDKVDKHLSYDEIPPKEKIGRPTTRRGAALTEKKNRGFNFNKKINTENFSAKAEIPNLTPQELHNHLKDIRERSSDSSKPTQETPDEKLPDQSRDEIRTPKIGTTTTDNSRMSFYPLNSDQETSAGDTVKEEAPLDILLKSALTEEAIWASWSNKDKPDEK